MLNIKSIKRNRKTELFFVVKPGRETASILINRTERNLQDSHKAMHVIWA
jgi:hypothetical protein